MSIFKLGDKVRLKGTFFNATISNNHCNGYYDLKFGDRIIITNVSERHIIWQKI